MTNYKKISACRVCGSNRMEQVLQLGDFHLSNFVKEGQALSNPVPLELLLCRLENGGCGLAQLAHTAELDEMYQNYWYRSGINHSMSTELADITTEIAKRIELHESDFVIDIGSNDGTLLRSYDVPGLKTIGFEPAKNLFEIGSKGNFQIISNYFNALDWQTSFGDEKAKVITAIGMFYDLETPNDFVSDVQNCLADDGLFVIQMMYLPFALQRNAFDGICHEHLEYYSLQSLNFLLNRHGLRIFDVQTRYEVNEGSLRFFICKDLPGSPYKKTLTVEKYEEFERTLQLDDPRTYEKFLSRTNELKDEVLGFITREKLAGKTIHGYAASTKGNTTLQYFNLGPDLIDVIADRNPEKWGTYTVATNIPVVSEEESRNLKPDYYFVLAWHFLPEFMEREKKFLDGGGKMILPLPHFAVMDGTPLQVHFGKNSSFEHSDERRQIIGFSDIASTNMDIAQVKLLLFTESCVENSMVIGNHRHIPTSYQWEKIYVLGDENVAYFKFRYRNLDGTVHETILNGSDFVFIPPGCSLALKPIRAGAKLLEISNQPYQEMNYEKDELFQEPL